MPEIIILDEPTVGLDPIQIIEIRSLIKELAKEHTVILSSHILSEISAVCDEILIISHGRLVANDKHLNLTSFEIRTDGADVREAVFGICAEKNWTIYEMKYSKATLEDVFMELTADNKAH